MISQDNLADNTLSKRDIEILDKRFWVCQNEK